MIRFILLNLIFIFLLSCQNEIQLSDREGWQEGYNVADIKCPISDFSIGGGKESSSIYFLEPKDITISFDKSSVNEDVSFVYEIFIDGQKIKEFSSIDKDILIGFDEKLKNLKFMDEHSIVISDSKFSKCFFNKAFSIVCPTGENYMESANSCGVCENNQVYQGKACLDCIGRKVNNGQNVCACENGALNSDCNECPSGLAYIKSIDKCATCSTNQIYNNQECITCPNKHINNGSNICVCANGALNSECNVCPTGLLYLKESDSCGTCAANQIYKDQACVTCSGKQINNGNNICSCANGALNSECNVCPTELLYLKESDSCGTCAANQIYKDQACVTCSGKQINNGNNICACANGALNIECYYYATAIEEFTQNEDNNKVDIIWVIDNSGSMSGEQNALAQNFESFIDAFVTNSSDYKMGITTTDTDLFNHDGEFQGEVPILHSGMSPTEVKSNFMINVKVGIKGSYLERGLLAAQLALGKNSISGSKNYNFLRPEAFLAIIIVSDENDSSTGTVQSYVDSIKIFKSKPVDLAIYSIINKSGLRYMDASNATGGFYEDIASDFSQSLLNIGTDIVELMKSFKLNNLPVISTIEVKVNGVKVETDLIDGWIYDDTLVSVKFNGAAVPPFGATIEIKYEYIVQ